MKLAKKKSLLVVRSLFAFIYYNNNFVFLFRIWNNFKQKSLSEDRLREQKNPKFWKIHRRLIKYFLTCKCTFLILFYFSSIKFECLCNKIQQKRIFFWLESGLGCRMLWSLIVKEVCFIYVSIRPPNLLFLCFLV